MNRKKKSKYMGMKNTHPFALKHMDKLHRGTGCAKLTRTFLWPVEVYRLMRGTENFNEIC